MPLEPNVGAFGNYVVAQQMGYYKEEGLDVAWLGAQGAVDGAKQVVAGNADLGSGLGPETAIIARAQGIPIKGISVNGGHPYHSIVSLDTAPIKTPQDLKGKTVAVVSAVDTSYFVLLATISAGGLTKDDVNIVPVGPTPALAQALIQKKADAFIGPPPYIAIVQLAGLNPYVMQVGTYFPGFAQGMFTSDANMKSKADILKGFVRASLRGLQLEIDNPDQATKLVLQAVPAQSDQEKSINLGFKLSNDLVHKDQNPLGSIDPDRVKKLQDYYLQQKLIDKASAVDDLYTNEFVPK
ncbi:MAG: ABC transporter substrate-binding protein [Dehalococcoidia bacterium]|nr:ABC transporter substrate-binding protein [Dehalococcoidia bacterium]